MGDLFDLMHQAVSCQSRASDVYTSQHILDLVLLVVKTCFTVRSFGGERWLCRSRKSQHSYLSQGNGEAGVYQVQNDHLCAAAQAIVGIAEARGADGHT